MLDIRQELMLRARSWVRRNECPLPVDLAMEMRNVGLDVDAIEAALLHGGDAHAIAEETD